MKEEKEVTFLEQIKKDHLAHLNELRGIRNRLVNLLDKFHGAKPEQTSTKAFQEPSEPIGLAEEIRKATSDCVDIANSIYIQLNALETII